MRPDSSGTVAASTLSPASTRRVWRVGRSMSVIEPEWSATTSVPLTRCANSSLSAAASVGAGPDAASWNGASTSAPTTAQLPSGPDAHTTESTAQASARRVRSVMG